MTSRIQDQNAASGLYQQMQQLETYIRTATDIEPMLVHLVKMRVSHITGCAYCLALHPKAGLMAGAGVAGSALLSAWREAPDWFSPRERAALTWAETLTKISTENVTYEIYASVREEFSEKDLADLTLLVITINGWNRIAIPFRAEPAHFDVPVPEAVAR